MAYIGRAPTDTGEFLQIDEISSSFDGSTRSFDLQIGTSPITPTKENIIVALDGVLQTAGSAYSISGSTVTFTEAPTAGTTFYGILTGQVGASVANNAITDDHVSGTTSISGSKIDTDFSAQVVKARVFDGMISGSAQIAASDSMTLATASIAAITASISTAKTDISTNSANMTLATASIAAITASVSSIKTDAFAGTAGTETVFSGSATSTGSFGSVHIMGNVNIGIAVANPSASAVLGSSDTSFTISGSIFPEGDAKHDLGSANYQWKNIYTSDFHLNNTSKTEGNSVDGTKGSWTIQEGREDLYLLNNETGKKFKFKLEEVK